MLAVDTHKQVLIVDRDIGTVEPLRLRLAENGFVVRAITDNAAALTAVKERPPHLVIVDWDMPGFAGLELVQGIRRVHSSRAIRLIILSALSGEGDIVSGLNLGADDYISKPYSLREVVARVLMLLRSRDFERKNTLLTCDRLELDPTTNRVTAKGQMVVLRGVEFRLLEFFMSHRDKTFNRNQLLKQVWGDDSEIDERTVDVNVQRLRKILSDKGFESYIQTVRGFGYRFSRPAFDRAEE